MNKLKLLSRLLAMFALMCLPSLNLSAFEIEDPSEDWFDYTSPQAVRYDYILDEQNNPLNIEGTFYPKIKIRLQLVDGYADNATVDVSAGMSVNVTKMSPKYLTYYLRPGEEYWRLNLMVMSWLGGGSRGSRIAVSVFFIPNW